MAYTNLYVQSGGNDANAGTTTANSAAVTSTNGSWDITADTFIATAGTPFSGLTTGDWASIYLDGATLAVYVAKIASVNLLGASITLSTTNKYGTKPSAGATGRSCKVNGAWATPKPISANGLGATTIPLSTKVNIKAATYTFASSIDFALSGSTTKSLWISGYNTTPGDLDDNRTDALTPPAFAGDPGADYTSSGSYQTWSNFNVTGTVNGFFWTASGNYNRYIRMRWDNADTHTFIITIYNTGLSYFKYCWFKQSTNSSGFAIVYNQGYGIYRGCTFESGYNGLQCQNYTSINNSTFLNQAGFAIGAVSVVLEIDNITIYNSGGDGIQLQALGGGLLNISGSLFVNCGGYGINNATGTDTGEVARDCNDFYACSSGNENGFGDSPALFGQTESASPVTSSTDMTPKLTSNAIANGFPGIFENESFSSYLDIGAVQGQAGSSGPGYVPQVFE